jgi:hypothetical protein
MRRATLSCAETLDKSKHLWEAVRIKTMKPEERAATLKGLFDVVRGNVVDLVFKHDGARVLQSAIQFGSPEQREAIYAEIKGTISCRPLFERMSVQVLIRLASAQDTSWTLLAASMRDS